MKTAALLVTLIFITLLLIVGATYEQVERTRDRERYPRVGHSVDIGGRSLDIDCAGTGTPTVVFEAGAPRPGYGWVIIQRQVAQLTRACWYDRAGFGWSDLGPYPRTSEASARDLHALLQRGNIAPPYVLVAESLAALDARVFTGFHPAEVAGVVMIDGVHPDLFTRAPQIRGKAAPVQKYIGYPQNIASRIFNEVGLLRLLSGERRAAPPPPPGFGAGEWNTVLRLANGPRARVALLEELPSVEVSAAQARASGNLGARPLRVLSKQPAEPQPVIDELQADLTRLSTRSRWLVVSQARPGPLYYQAPQSVIDTIREVVSEVRTTP